MPGMNPSATIAVVGVWRAAIPRALFFFFVWVLVAHQEPADIAVGLISAALATWASLNLLPAGAMRPRLLGVLAIAARFPGQAIVAGWDVALRAMRSEIRLDPGNVSYRYASASGPARQTFDSVMSLFPGTLPSGLDAKGEQVIHCLDVAQPVADQMAQEEAAFRRAFAAMADSEIGHG